MASRGVCLVTGGSRGIGRAAALAAARAGYDVGVNFRTAADEAARVVAAVGEGGGHAVALPGDVAREADVVAMFERAERELGPVTALVNSAGIGYSARVEAFDASELARLVAVNVTGLMICCREAVRRMSTRRGGSGGAIVSVSSMAATIGGRPGSSAYAASKAAVDAFTVGLAKEVAGEGIRVNAVRPGMTATDMTAGVLADAERGARTARTIPMGRFATAEEVAAAVLWLLSPEASFVTGARLDVSGGGFVVGGA